MDDQPRSVKDLLVEAKDASELMVDLAYAAVFFDDEKVAREVERLEERMSDHLRRLRMMAMLAARNPDDAEGMAGVLWIADAIEKVGDAASDIGRVVEAKLGIPDALRRDLRHADEMTARVKVRDGSRGDRADAPRSVAADRDRHVGHGDPQRDRAGGSTPAPRTCCPSGDVLLVRGPEEGVNLVRELAGAPPLPEPPDDDAPPLSELDRAVDILVELKDLSEAAVGLAYSSLLFNDRSLAAEVGSLEARSDILHDELESWVLRSAPEARDPDELRGLLRLGERERVDVRRGARHDVVRRAGRAAAPGRADGARGDRGDRARGRRRGRARPPTAAPSRSCASRPRRGCSSSRSSAARGGSTVRADRSSSAPATGVIAVGPEEGAEELEALCRVAAPVEG